MKEGDFFYILKHENFSVSVFHYKCIRLLKVVFLYFL